MDNKNEQNMKGAILQICVMLLNAIGTKNCMAAVKHLESKYSSYTFNYLSMNKADKVLDMVTTTDKYTMTWMRYLANMISKIVGVTFYTIKEGTNGGFNKSLHKSTAIAILKHFGCITTNDKGDPIFNKSDLTKMLDSNDDFYQSLVQALTSVEVAEEVTEEAWDDEEDEFADFEEVAVSDKVVAFDALSAGAKADYPLATLLMSFFELIKTCGSATGTILNFKHVSNALGNVKYWRPNAKDAIANGKDTYRNKKGQLREIKCVTSYVDDGDKFHLSVFGYSIATEMVLKSLNFNYNNKKNIFYDMKDAFMGGDTKKALGFIASGLRLIMNAVNNGAPSSAIGVGFSQYLDAKDIYAIVDAYTTDGEFYDNYSIKGSTSRSAEVIDESFDDVLA